TSTPSSVPAWDERRTKRVAAPPFGSGSFATSDTVIAASGEAGGTQAVTSTVTSSRVGFSTGSMSVRPTAMRAPGITALRSVRSTSSSTSSGSRMRVVTWTPVATRSAFGFSSTTPKPPRVDSGSIGSGKADTPWSTTTSGCPTRGASVVVVVVSRITASVGSGPAVSGAASPEHAASAAAAIRSPARPAGPTSGQRLVQPLERGFLGDVEGEGELADQHLAGLHEHGLLA